MSHLFLEVLFWNNRRKTWFTGKMAAKISTGGSDPHIKNNA